MRSTWGNITKVKNGVYRLRYTVPLPEGGTKQKCETVHGTQREASLILAQRQREIKGSSYSVDTVDNFWNNVFIPECKERKLAPGTIKGYETVYKTHVQPVFGDKTLSDITGRQVQTWLNGLSYGGARHAKSALSAMMGRAYALDMVETNVMARRYVLPQRDKMVVNVEADVFTPDDLNYIYSHIEGEYWEPTFILSAFGGARREESCSPKLDEIEFNQRSDGQFFASVEIVRGFQHIDGKVVEVKPKTRTSKRYIVIPEPYSVRLYEIVQDLKAQGFRWLLDDGNGWVISPNTMAAAYKRWFLNQPIRYLPWKNLRNTYCTIMHANGVDLGMIAKLLGHPTEQTTFRHYDRPDREQLMDVVSQLA